MRISFIGAGRVATHLAKAFSTHHEIVDICSRSLESSSRLARLVGAQACAQAYDMRGDIDLLVIAVSDQAIAKVIGDVAKFFEDVLIVHTSGSTNIQVLTQAHQRSGVFYPLQTFSLEREIDWLSTPLLIETAVKEDQKILVHLAESISKNVYSYNSEQRLSLHLAAVFACNFSNYCYDMAHQIVDAQSVDFSLLHPLILETAHKATQYAPHTVQTGPAVRGDQNIIQMHTHMLEEANRMDLSAIYECMSVGILKRKQ